MLRTNAIALMTFAATTSVAFASDVRPTPSFHLHVRADGHLTTVTAPAGYSPAQIGEAYGLSGLGETGAGQTIAIVDAYGSANILSDAAHFSSYYGLPAPNITVAYASGAPKGTDSGWALETSLDVEWAHAIAPGAKILLVVARSSSLSDLLAAVSYAAAQKPAQVSMSWGASEFATETSYDSYFNHAGINFFASSGDSGTGVIWPAASPYVVGVGGTTLELNSSGGRTSAETAWSDSGGGESRYESEPAFQSAWQSSGRREVPDVSFDANPATGVAVYDTVAYDGESGWFEVGGTSLGAPSWAAISALVNQSLSAPMTAANATLYALAGSESAPSTDFDEIVSGCNSSASSTLTCAHAGYNTVTGLGTPDGSVLIPAWVTAK